MNYFNYFSEIEETFVRRRGRNLLLSPLDWALIEAWKERGIPLQVVVRGIETVFDGADAQLARKRGIKSLMYCREEVEAQYAEWLSSQVGNEAGAERKPQNAESKSDKNVQSLLQDSQSEVSNERIFSHLQRIENRLRLRNTGLNHNWDEISLKIADKLKLTQTAFKSDGDFEKLENALGELDRMLDETLIESFPSDKLAELKSETAEQLRAYKNRMSGETYAQTFKTLLLKSLREQTDLPRLSLFYL